MTFGPNQHGRDFVVGDIHGHLELFRRLLASADFDPGRDRVFSVGDLIDRGPDSVGCIRLLEEPWFHAVRANHEDMLARTAAGNPTSWMANGGRWWSDVADNVRAECEVLVAFMPMAIVVNGSAGRFNVVHAEFFGTDADLDRGEFTKEQRQTMMWGRDIIGGFGPETPGLSITFVGHTPVEQVCRRGSHVYIDTGAFLPGRFLTMVEPATGLAYQVDRGDGD